MKNLRELFTEHPASVGETYLQHFGRALGFSLRMVAGGLACLVHAVLPFLFVRTGSRTIAELHDSMITHRDRRPASPAVPERPLGTLSRPVNPAR